MIDAQWGENVVFLVGIHYFNEHCLGLVQWHDPEGWYGEGGGRRVQDGEHVAAAVAAGVVGNALLIGEAAIRSINAARAS